MAVYRLGEIKEENYIMTANEIEKVFEVATPLDSTRVDIPITKQRTLTIKRIESIEDINAFYDGEYNNYQGKDFNKWYFEALEPSAEVLSELENMGFDFHGRFIIGLPKEPTRDFDNTPLRLLANDIFKEINPPYEQGNYGKENKEQWVDTLTNYMIVNPRLLSNYIKNPDNVSRLESVINNHVDVLPQSAMPYERAGVFGAQKEQEIKEAFEQGATPEEVVTLIGQEGQEQKKAMAATVSPKENQDNKDKQRVTPKPSRNSTFMAWKEKTPEQRAEEYRIIKENVRITDLAQEYGYKLKRIGGYQTLQEHESVRIKEDTNYFYRNSNGVSGSCIDFALEFGPYVDKKDVIKDFARRAGIEEGKEYIPPPKPKVEKFPEKEKKVELVLPERAPRVNKVFAYLTSHRNINKDIVSEFIQDHRLYQDKRNNCVFVSYDENEKPVFACLRGTNTYVEKPFIGDVKGSDYSRCMYIDNGADKLIINEAIIDTMSVMTFKRHNQFSDKNYNYLALASANKYAVTKTHLKEHPEIKEVYGGFDNDEAGERFNAKTKAMLKELKEEGWEGTYTPMFPAFTNDWNEELKYCKENKIRYDYYKPSQAEVATLEKYCNAKYECHEFGHDPRKFTKAKRERDDILEELKSTDIPKGMLKYADAFYENTKVLDRYPHVANESAEVIINHYNTKDMTFKGYEKGMEMKQNNILTQQIAKAAYARGQEKTVEIGLG